MGEAATPRDAICVTILCIGTASLEKLRIIEAHEEADSIMIPLITKFVVIPDPLYIGVFMIFPC